MKYTKFEKVLENNDPAVLIIWTKIGAFFDVKKHITITQKEWEEIGNLMRWK